MFNPGVRIMLDNSLAEWGEIPYAELSIVLCNLHFLYHLHQQHHWVSKGDSYYGDHLLFQRLYEKVAEEIDMVAEKAVGLGDDSNVNMSLLMSGMVKHSQGMQVGTIVQGSGDLANRSLQAEQNFLAMTAAAVDSLGEKGQLSRGLDNLVAGIEDTHEGHIYLLKQRTK